MQVQINEHLLFSQLFCELVSQTLSSNVFLMLPASLMNLDENKEAECNC